MALKIKNRTRYRADDLRAFFLAGLKSLGAGTDKTIVVIDARRRDGVHGRASLPAPYETEGRWLRMSLPRLDKLDMRKIAQVFEHEVGHNFGDRHGEMQKWWTLEPKWHEGLMLRVKAEPKKTPAPERREKNVRAMIAKYESELLILTKKKARFQKLLKKWRVKARYYDRKAASIAPPREP